MRRRTVKISVSDKFYKMMEEERKRVDTDIKKISNRNKDLSWPELTEMMAKNKSIRKLKLRAGGI